MSGYREFAVGEVLTSSNVNEFLMNQSVMVFADSSARDSALGTATGGTAALVEGMTVYRQDAEALEYFDGEVWRSVPPVAETAPTDGQILAYGTASAAYVPVDPPGFNARVVITATDASWSVPALANPVVKVTCVGAGGGGSDSGSADGGAGGTTSFGGYLSAGGGAGADQTDESSSPGTAGWASMNGGAANFKNGNGGHVEIAYVDLTAVSTVNVTIGAGGTGQAGAGAGGRGEVVVEYRAA